MEINMKMTPKDFFLHLASIVTLYVSAVSLLVLVFHIVDIAFPDNLNYYIDPYSSGIRFAIASLVIIFPLYLFLTWLLNRDYSRAPEKREFAIRKWLTTFPLFITGAAIIVDLVILLNEFLGGEITTRFVLKVVAVLVVATAVFTYYIHEMRSSAPLTLKERRVYRFSAILLVFAAIIGGFMVMGSPTTQRLVKFDMQKVNDLESIQWQIVNYWQIKQALPSKLDDLNDPISSYMTPKDRQTGEVYKYEKVSNLSFRLCATFNKKSIGNNLSLMHPKAIGLENTSWQHEAGAQCFERTIDPERYPSTRQKI